jgi:hypothetical protein
VPKITTEGPLDLSAYTGDEHTVFYRGRISRLGPISESEIRLQCETDEPGLVWGVCADATTAAPRDLGTRYPRPYGSKSRLPCPAHTVGWATTLAESINRTRTGLVQVTDTTGFPTSGSFNAQLEGELCVCNGNNTDTGIIDITTRGSGSTDAAAHAAGATVIEVPSESIYIVADDGAAPIQAVNDVYVKNPFNDEITKLSGVEYAFDASDTDVDTGKTLSTIIFSDTQLRTLYKKLFRSARVSVQAVYNTGAAPSTVLAEPGTGGTTEAAVANIKNGTWTDAADPYFDGSIGASDLIFKKDMPSGLDGAKNVLKWRLKLKVENETVHSGQQNYIRMGSDASGTFPYDTVDAAIPQAAGADITVYGDYHYPTYGTKLSAIQGDTFTLYCYPHGSEHPEVYVREWGVEAELENASTVTRDIDAEIEGAGFGYPLEVFADVEGTVAPASSVTAAMVYDFDDDTNWNSGTGITRSTDTGIYYEATGSQKVILAPTVEMQCEAADSTDKTAWTASNCTLADETTIKTEGSASVKGTSTGASACTMTRLNFTPTIDLTAGEKKFLLFDIRINKNGGAGGSIRFEIGNDTSNYLGWWPSLENFDDDTWYTVVIDYEDDDWNASADGGGRDFSAMDFLRIGFNNGATKVSGFVLYVDNIRTIPKLGYAQKNDVASIDMSSAVNYWRYALRVDSDAKELLASVRVYFDNTAGSGVTPPSPLSYCQVQKANFAAADSWALPAATVSAAGDEDAVQTIGIRLAVVGYGTYPVASTSPTVYVDQLEAASAISGLYSVAEGAMIEKPTDILRHWIEAVGGLTVDETSFAAALTNLGSNILAVDMRQLTPGDWRTGAAGLGFHSRGNVVPKETPSGTVYAFYTAESDYDWPVYDREVTAWQTFGEAGPQGRERFTRLRAYYNFDASGGAGNERDFHSVIRGDEDDNDLTVPSTANFQAAANKYGTTAPKVFFFPGIEDDATAKDVLGYYAHEAIRAPRVFLLDGCFWWEVYELEEDDLVQITHPWSGDTIKARVLGYTKRFASEANSLVALEVE